MESISRPTKVQVRQYIEQRRAAQCPPPPVEEIRRQLGWTVPNDMHAGKSLVT